MVTPMEWSLGNDTGLSSTTILIAMTGAHPAGGGRTSRPWDPDDFGRCYRLLRLFPEWRPRMPEVATRFPEWGPLVEAWDELTTLYERLCGPDGRYEVPRVLKGQGRGRRKQYVMDEASPQGIAWNALYARMKSLEDACYLAGGWTKTGPGSWRKGEGWTVAVGPGVTMSSGGGSKGE